MLPEYLPDEETLAKRRERKYVVNPKDVTVNDEVRIREWALEIMQKHSSRLNDQVPNGHIVFEKEVEPEEINIRNVAEFEDMYYMIFKRDIKKGRELQKLWCLRLCYRTASGSHAILADHFYANIDGI